MTTFLGLLCGLLFILTHAQAALPQANILGRQSGTDFVDPASVGGNLYFRFNNSPTTKPEPINVIISAASSFGSYGGSNDTEIFLRSKGLSQYLNALNFSDECRGLHLSTPAYANVSSSTPELLDFLYRENFGSYPDGTCLQSVIGGHHFRGWRQGLFGAWFLAASKELNLTLHHDLVPNGYDIGRDEVVARAMIGGKDPLGCVWPAAQIADVTNLATADAGGEGGAYNHDIGIDGIVKLITVGAPACPPPTSTSPSGASDSAADVLSPRSSTPPSSQTTIPASTPSSGAIPVAEANFSVRVSFCPAQFGLIIGIISIWILH